MREALGKLVLTSAGALLPTLAAAQSVGVGSPIVIAPELDRPDVAGARQEPGFEPKPVPIGPFFVLPAFSAIGSYTSNVFNRSNGRGDAALTAVPAVAIRSDLPRHDLKLTAAAAIRRYGRFTRENSEEFQVVLDGRADLADRNAVMVKFDVARLVEPRSTAGSVPDAIEPISFARLAGEVGARVELGRLRLLPTVDFEQVEYSPVSLATGSRAVQSFRDTRGIKGEMRLEYDLSGLVSTFAAVTYSDIDSTHARSAALRRDSRNMSVTAGLRGELSPVVSGRLAIGYQSRQYQSPTFRDFAGLTFNGDLQWYVTPLVTLRAQAGRSFRNSGFTQVAGILTDTVTLSAFYDPLRNLRLSASGSLERGAYRETDTRTWRQSFRLQAQYRLNSSISVGGYVGAQHQSVRGTRLVNPFSSLSAGLGITIVP